MQSTPGVGPANTVARAFNTEEVLHHLGGRKGEPVYGSILKLLPSSRLTAL
jgi:hypothetical protein